MLAEGGGAVAVYQPYVSAAFSSSAQSGSNLLVSKKTYGNDHGSSLEGRGRSTGTI